MHIEPTCHQCSELIRHLSAARQNADRPKPSIEYPEWCRELELFAKKLVTAVDHSAVSNERSVQIPLTVRNSERGPLIRLADLCRIPWLQDALH